MGDGRRRADGRALRTEKPECCAVLNREARDFNKNGYVKNFARSVPAVARGRPLYAGKYKKARRAADRQGILRMAHCKRQRHTVRIFFIPQPDQRKGRGNCVVCVHGPRGIVQEGGGQRDQISACRIRPPDQPARICSNVGKPPT